MKWLFLALPGGLLLLLAVILLRRWAASQPDEQLHIPPLGPQHYRFTSHDEALAMRAALRRAEADKKRKEAAAITSGQQKPRLWKAQG